MGNGNRGQVGVEVLRLVHMENCLPHNLGREHVSIHNMKEKAVPERVKNIGIVMQNLAQVGQSIGHIIKPLAISTFVLA